ncbi:MAG: hypothetical protein ACXWVT_03495 [Burkholderiaceae bacterium]
MRTGQPGGSDALFDVFVPPKPESKAGQKPGTARSDCEPGTRPSAGSASGKKPGTVRSDCEPMTRPSAGSASGQKHGTSRSDCEPGIAPRGDATRAQPNDPRLAHTFPNGTRLVANIRNGVIQDYSGFDPSGDRFRVIISRDRLASAAPSPGDTIERARQRAEEEHKRLMEQMRVAIESAQSKGCVIVILTPDGNFHSYRGCPKGV